jgi:hypothetical protein
MWPSEVPPARMLASTEVAITVNLSGRWTVVSRMQAVRDQILSTALFDYCANMCMLVLPRARAQV